MLFSPSSLFVWKVNSLIYLSISFSTNIKLSSPLIQDVFQALKTVTIWPDDSVILNLTINMTCWRTPWPWPDNSLTDDLMTLNWWLTCWLPHWCHLPSWGYKARGWWRCHCPGSSTGQDFSQLFYPGQDWHSAHPPTMTKKSVSGSSDPSQQIHLPGWHSQTQLALDWTWVQPQVLSIAGLVMGQRWVAEEGRPVKITLQ